MATTIDPTADRLQRRAALALIAATAAWGSTFVMVQDAVASMDVLDFLALRFAAATVLLVALRPQAVLRIPRDGRIRGVWLGVFLGLGFVLQTVGLQYTSAAVSGFLTGMMVVLTPLVSAVVLRRRVEPMAWLAVGIATIGLAVISLNGWAVGTGELLTLAGALMYALHIVGLGEWSTPESAYGLAVIQCGTVALMCGVPAALGDGIQLPPDGQAWFAVLFTAVVASAMGFVVQSWSQAHLTATRAAIILTMEPVFAGVFAVLLGGETLTLRVILGGALVLVAMYVAELGPRGSQDGRLPHLEP